MTKNLKIAKCSFSQVQSMVKESRKEKKLQKRDIDSEYSTWPQVDYKFQDAKFFEVVKKLPASGLNPKGDINNAHATIIDIAKVFGNIQKFGITNPLLIDDQKKKSGPSNHNQQLGKL